MGSFRLCRGFSLTELIVVLGIIGLLTVVVLTSQHSFNKTITLVNTTYDIALSLRSAQVFGLGSRATAAGVVNTPYGIHIEGTESNTYVLFADTHPIGDGTTPNCPEANRPDCQPGNYVYTDGSDTRVQQYTIQNGIYIKDFCAYGMGAWWCNATGETRISSLDIVFGRPDPDPFFAANGTYYDPPDNGTQACLIIASASAPSGPYRYIRIYQTGEITASTTVCPS